MKSDSLLYFDTPVKLDSFLKSINLYDKWKIQHGFMNDRGKNIEGKRYTKILREIFSEKEFFRRNVSLAEVVTWLDNLTLMSRVLNELNTRLSPGAFSRIQVAAEYCIKLSKNMRVDFLIIYNNKICILEFRTNDDFNKIRASWEKKKLELLIYKDLLGNYLEGFRFYTYAFIALFEYSKGNEVHKNIEYNNNQVKYLVKYLIAYMFA